jgi:putative endopeptidase
MIPVTLRYAALLALAIGGTTAGAQVPTRPLERANMDTTCKACENFYQFANGGWMKKTVIPASYPAYGSLTEVADRNEAVVHTILEDAAHGVRSAKPGSNIWKVGTFYGACMDSSRIESLGAAPLKSTLDVIDAIKTPTDVANSFGELERRAGIAPFQAGSLQDFKNANEIIATAGQSGLGLPERDYYLRTDAKSVALREKYLAHVTHTLALIGEGPDDARTHAAAVVALETKLAEASMPRVTMRDPNNIYHRMTLAEFQAIVPHLDLPHFLAQVGAERVAAFNVRQPDFFKALDLLITSVPVADWQSYLRYHAADKASPMLSSAFVNEAFSWTQNLSGAKELRPRWKRCSGATNAMLGEAVGEEYVRRTFTPEAKARALTMVNNLRDALRERIGKLSWMSDTTKRMALVKLDAFTRKIGYPDQWRDYSALEIRDGEYLGNMRRATQFEDARDWAKIGRPIDKTEWSMTPPTVNAYYNPIQNEIVFPAGILQPPVFDPNADDAVNYGGMGAVIGHEMTHGFDDSGRQFDAQGNLRDWWTASDAAAYKTRAQLVSDQFDSYTVLDSATHVNGKLTLGENIADLGGLTIAYAAFQKALAGKPRPANIDGFTPEQRFFLSYAQTWRQQMRPEQARVLINVDPHAPHYWRVNGPLSNMPEFARAFGCKSGDTMARGDAVRAQIW